MVFGRPMMAEDLMRDSRVRRAMRSCSDTVGLESEGVLAGVWVWERA